MLVSNFMNFDTTRLSHTHTHFDDGCCRVCCWSWILICWSVRVLGLRWLLVPTPISLAGTGLTFPVVGIFLCSKITLLGTESIALTPHLIWAVWLVACLDPVRSWFRLWHEEIVSSVSTSMKIEVYTVCSCVFYVTVRSVGLHPLYCVQYIGGCSEHFTSQAFLLRNLRSYFVCTAFSTVSGCWSLYQNV